MPTCYILIGPMGCGKSTWCETMRKTLNDPVVVSTDDIVEEYAAREGRTYSEVFLTTPYPDLVKQAGARLTRAAIQGRDIIIDQTNCTVLDRKRFRHLIPASYTIVGVEFEFDAEVLRQRVTERSERTGKVIPLSVLQSKIDKYTPPMEGEFDEVIRVPFIR